eukprot:11068337-Ditylum_brightwellii.AAC.1
MGVDIILNGDLVIKEGIWLHIRLIAEIKDNTTYSNITFNPESCYAPEVQGTSLGIAVCTGMIIEGDGCDGRNIDIISE